MAIDAASLIAKRYARALFSLGREQRQLEALEQDMQTLASWSSAPETTRFLATPLLARDAKAEAMEALLAKTGASALMRQFVRRLALNNRLAALPGIAKHFAHLLAESRGEVQAEVVTARPLSPEHARALEAAIAGAYHKNPRLQQRNDPALLAGFVLRIDGIRMDYSLAGQLDRLRMALKTGSSSHPAI